MDRPVFKVGLGTDGTVDHPSVLNAANGLTLTGRIRVDLGRTEENPVVLPCAPVMIGTYVGTAPDLSNWKLDGSGNRRVFGTFSAQAGIITVKPSFGGLAVFVR